MIFVLVVLYNKSLSHSDTLCGMINASEILNSKGFAVFLWDNSLHSMNKKDLEILKRKISNFHYHHAPENTALSRIYNVMLEKIISEKSYKYIILFDDDSKISSSYFNEVVNVMHKDFDVLLPVVKNNGKIVSPSEFFYCKGIFFKTIESGSSQKKLLAINSGMAIATSFISQNNFRYNEQLINYGTDNYFMHFANRNNAKFYILNYSFSHNLSFFNDDNLEKKIEIFRQIKKANKIIFSSNPLQSLITRFYNFSSSLKNSVKYKTMKFFS